jgi:hypothetical protein
VIQSAQGRARYMTSRKGIRQITQNNKPTFKRSPSVGMTLYEARFESGSKVTSDPRIFLVDIWKEKLNSKISGDITSKLAQSTL